MANIPKELIERTAFMSRVIHNAGMSAKEAAKSFELLGQSFKKTKVNLDSKFPISDLIKFHHNDYTPFVWQEKVAHAVDTDSYFREYMQDPFPTYTSTFASSTGEEAEINIEKIKESIKSLQENEDRRLEIEMFRNYGSNTSIKGPDKCPYCMADVAWYRAAGSDTIRCEHCNTEFDLWSLENSDFQDLRIQALEMVSRQRGIEIERVRARNEYLSHSRAYHIEPQSRPEEAINPTNMDLADEIRTLMAHRNLNATQMQRLNELIGIVQGSPPPGLYSHPDSYAGEFDDQRESIQRQQLPGELDRPETFLTEEIYKGFGFGSNDSKQEKPVKPLIHPKRKLDI